MIDTDEEIEQKENWRSGIDIPWTIAGAVITIAAALFRFYDLTLKPLHHDEGVNGFFLTSLFRDGVYKYDPANYHGPTLYYIALAFAKVGGLTTTSVRMSVAAFGVLIVGLALYLRRYLGRIGSLAAALFLALSPGMIYISRYFIHEMFFCFCSLAIVVSVILFIEKRRAGPLAIVWMSILLLTCFLPFALNIAAYLGGENTAALWSFRVAAAIVACVLIYFVVRMLMDWRDGRPIYLMLAAAAVALLFATKETAFITLGTMAIACGAAYLWRRIYSPENAGSLLWPSLALIHVVIIAAALIMWDRSAEALTWVHDNFLGEGRVQEPFAFYILVILTLAVILTWAVFLFYLREPATPSFSEPRLSFKPSLLDLGSKGDKMLLAAAAAVTFTYIVVLFFSSFFTYREGLRSAVEAYTLWTKTGTKEHTQNGYLAYLRWGIKVESPLLLLSTLGAAITWLRPRHRFAVFTAFWAFGMFAAYTIIPYKTPWLALSFYLPMALVAGYGVGQLIESRRMVVRTAGVVVTLLAAVMLAYQAYDLNFVRYDDEEMGYVYAHTKRGALELIDRINFYAEKSGKGKDATIEFVSPDYWPLTWYLNDFTHANFHGQLVDANTSEMIVAKKNDQDTEVVRRYSSHYKLVGVYPLRPGVDLMLLVNRSIAEPEDQDLYKIYEYETK